MSCITSACNGFVNCQQELNCPIGRCQEEYIPPAKLPQNIDTDIHSMSLQNFGSGTAIAPVEVEYFSDKPALVLNTTASGTTTSIANQNLGLVSLWETGTTGSSVIISFPQQFLNVTFSLATFAVGLTLSFEYWDGAWQTIFGISDGTTNMTGDGAITWLISNVSGWTVDANGLYSIRLLSITTNPTTAPIINDNGITFPDITTVKQTVGAIPWQGPEGISNGMYMMNVNTDTSQVLQDKSVLYYGSGSARNAVIIFYQDPQTSIWYIWNCNSTETFIGTDRNYVKMVPMLIETSPDTWVLNPGVFSNTSTYTVYPEYLFYVYNASNPLENSNTPLTFSTVLAIQSVDIVFENGDVSDPFNSSSRSWLIKGNEQLFGEDFCLTGEPMLLAYSRDEIPTDKRDQIGKGINVGNFCTNVNCLTPCTMAYFMVAQKNGCLPPLSSSGQGTQQDTQERNMWIVIGVLAGLTLILIIVWLIVAAKFKGT